MSLAASYVHRCFLSDIPATIERQWRTAANTSKSPTSSSSKYIHQRRLLSKTDASSSSSTTATPNEPVYLRLLGTVVEVLKPEHDNDSNDTAVTSDCASVAGAGAGAASQHTNINTIILVLDDGTGSLTQIQTPSAMATRIQVQPGMTLECIVRATTTGATTSSKQQNNPYYSLLAHQLVVVQDPHAETLRWLELTYRKKACEESVHNSSNNNHNQDTGSQLPTSVQSVEQFGYPCSGTGIISAEELYYIILSDCETEKSNNARVGGSSKSNNNNNNNKIRGVSLTDLAEGLEVSESLLEGLIEDLQLAGQIYRNEDGNYLPL